MQTLPIRGRTGEPKPKISCIDKAEQALNILIRVPEEKWCDGFFADNKGRSCAIGLINKYISGDAQSSYEGYGIRRLSQRYVSKHKDRHIDIANINNLPSEIYPQKTCKGRVIALLQDMVAAGY